MDRAKLNAIIGQALDVMACEDCHPEFYRRVSNAIVECAATHTATTLGNKVRDGEITPIEAFDRLTEVLRPLYREVGQDIGENALAAIRQYVELRAGADLN